MKKSIQIVKTEKRNDGTYIVSRNAHDIATDLFELLKENFGINDARMVCESIGVSLIPIDDIEDRPLPIEIYNQDGETNDDN